ncbi:MAG TPA: hypothetical protein PKM57_15100 [Kiritimatiellia bacterium]|nr:hypothetical protein [Kiritimatiellia bacterium]HPS08316.1 hypothetical protein [Kiritimatiellia bacterium]
MKKQYGLYGVCLSWVMLVVCGVSAATNEWYPGGSGFTGWPTNWVAMPSLNDPKGDAIARLDFVGDSFNPGAYWSANSNYFFVRMRMAVSNVIDTTYRDSIFIYIDRVGFTNGNSTAGNPDYALAWDSKSNHTAKHGLELMTGTNLSAVTDWRKMALDDIDASSSQKIAPPDFNLTGDGYLRTIDMRPTTNFGYTTYIDFAVKWSFISANTALNTNQQWRIQFGSRNDANDHNFPQDDIAGGYSPGSVVTSAYSSAIASLPLSSSVSFSVYATSRGIQAEIWTVDESDRDDIVVYAWLDGRWTEVGRVPAAKVWGSGSHCYWADLAGLSVGGSYLFKVVDEAGVEHYLPVATEVKTFKVSAMRMERDEVTMTFDTEAGHNYTVQVSYDLVNWTAEAVRYPTVSGWSDPDSAPFTAGPGTQTQVRVPANGRKKAYFKIVPANE